MLYSPVALTSRCIIDGLDDVALHAQRLILWCPINRVRWLSILSRPKRVPEVCQSGEVCRFFLSLELRGYNHCPITRVTVLGISPRFMSEVKSRGIHPRRFPGHVAVLLFFIAYLFTPVNLAPFDSLRTLFCTGAVLTPPMFEFAQRSFGQRVHIASGSGGTDICSSCE